MRESGELARTLVVDSLATLENEFPEKHRQFIPQERQPLQRFPRLTFPALVDPEPARGARKSASWLFPFVIDKRQLGDIPTDALTGELRFWLVPHGADVATARWADVTECLVRADARDTIFALDDDRQPDRRPPGAIVPTFARRDRLRGVVFEIPTRTAAAGMEVAPGFYDLRALPRLNALRDVTIGTPALEQTKAALQVGDWIRALRAVRELDPADLTRDAAGDLRAMAAQSRPATGPGRCIPRRTSISTFRRCATCWGVWPSSSSACPATRLQCSSPSRASSSPCDRSWWRVPRWRP